MYMYLDVGIVECGLIGLKLTRHSTLCMCVIQVQLAAKKTHARERNSQHNLTVKANEKTGRDEK